ncbi:MAG: WD40 repeat domain-containing protein [Endozoicomonas sp.]|uniref:WD40 repeat domain-containing protein n=1 Tax=Endozoicomonas sp. TaxID=1892382 RepID=UPI003D9BF985
MAEPDELGFLGGGGAAGGWHDCPNATMFHAIHFIARTARETTFNPENVNSIHIINFICENYLPVTPLPESCQPANPNPIHTENILLPALAVAADNTIKQITFSPDGQKLLVSDGDSAKLWDLNNLNPAETQSPVAVLPSSEAVNHGAISLDNQKAVTVDSGNILKLWNLANLTFENAVPQPELLDSIQLQGEPWQAAFDPDGKRLVVVGNFKFAELYGISEGNNGTEINHLTHLPHPDNVVYAAFSPDNAFLVTATDYPAARYWELGRQPLSNEGERTLPLHAFMQPDFYIPDNAYLLTETSDHPVAYSPSGRYLVTLLYQMGLVWDLEDQYRNYLGEPRSSLLATAWHNQHDQYDYIVFATFASSDQYLLTASTDKTARLWDISQLSYSKNVDRVVPELLAVLEHEDSVVYADFHPDKNYVVTASSNTVKLWNLNTIRCSSQNHLTPELLATLPHEAPVQQVVFDPGKKFLVSISSDNKWFLWDISGLLSQSSNEEL